MKELLNHKPESEERKNAIGEVFTPIPLVNEILDKLPQELFTDATKTIIDNSCGNGNFLVEVFKRKLEHNCIITTTRLQKNQKVGKYYKKLKTPITVTKTKKIKLTNKIVVQALSTIYGVELMSDNIEECRKRLLEIVYDNLTVKGRKQAIIGCALIVSRNIVCADALKYDYEFGTRPVTEAHIKIEVKKDVNVVDNDFMSF